MTTNTAEKYRQDPAFRELQRKRARLNYWSKRPLVQRPDPEVLRTDLKADIPVNGGKTVTVPIYRVGTVAKILGISSQSVRIWESRGILPDSGLTLDSDRPSRGYTYDQVRAIYDLMPLLNFPDSRDETPPKPNPGNKNKYPKGAKDPAYERDLAEYEEKMATHRYDHNPFSRELKARWARLVNGVDPDNLTVAVAKKGEG